MGVKPTYNDYLESNNQLETVIMYQPVYDEFEVQVGVKTVPYTETITVTKYKEVDNYEFIKVVTGMEKEYREAIITLRLPVFNSELLSYDGSEKVK